VDGAALVQHAVDAAGGAGGDVVVVLGAYADEIERALVLPPNARIVRNPDFADGQSTSLRAGVKAVGDGTDAVVVVLADQPGVTAADVRSVADAFASTGRAVVRASYRGRPGHPVLFARRMFPELLACAGDEGAREVVRHHEPDVVAAPIDRDLPGDVDTPGDLRALGGNVSPPGNAG
jgi:molybdenum cofactor cytidylyltransferase